MKIAFVGKGGSGKTTLSSLFVRYLASLNKPVLAIDADINQHLGNALGLSERTLKNVPELGIEIKKLKNFLRGENSLIHSDSEMIKTTPPGKGSNLINFKKNDFIWDYFSLFHNGYSLMRVGEMTSDDIGIRCYHSKNGSVELLLNHFLDQEGEYVVVDMTAGADAFASGLFTRFDMTVIAVEPSLKSISVYQQYKEKAKEYGVSLKVIANKIHDDSDLEFIKNHVGEDLISSFSFSDCVRKMERGEIRPLSELGSENLQTLENIKFQLDKQVKNWDLYFQQAVEFHEKNSKSWANESVGKDLLEQIDRSFSYEHYL